MYSKFVIRVLDAVGELIGWTEVQAHARGDGCMWAEEDVLVAADRAGAPASISVHWADVNIEIRVAIHVPAVVQGQSLKFPAGILMKVGDIPQRPLPPVTVKSAVSVGVPVGSLTPVSGLG